MVAVYSVNLKHYVNCTLNASYVFGNLRPSITV